MVNKKIILKVTLMIAIMLFIVGIKSNVFAARGYEPLAKVTNVRINDSAYPFPGEDETEIIWDKVENADGYYIEIYDKTGNVRFGIYEYSGDSNFRRFMHKGITDCRVKVSAVEFLDGGYAYGEPSDEFVLSANNSAQLEAPKNIRIEFIDGVYDKVLLKWDEVVGATGYEIDAYEGTFFSNVRDGGYAAIDMHWNTSSNSVEIGIEYLGWYLEVTPYQIIKGGNNNYGKTGQWVQERDVYVDTVPQVTNVTPTVTGKKVKVNWAKVDGAEGYEVVFTSVVNKKTVTWKYNRKTTSISFSSFPKRNGYNVTVRAYKTVDGQKQYGDYSVAKTFDVK